MPLVMQMLSHRNTKQKVFSNTKIRKVLKEFGEDINDSQIRKIVFHIRNNDLINLLIANNEGYFVSYNRADVEKWIQMQAGKISAMESTLFSIKRQLESNVKAMVDGETTEMKGQMSIYDIIS
jgi:tRNA A-37 threonylcarbamoyl transferase component Bud32